MDHLWSPWRYRYVTKASPTDGCIFCTKAAENRDHENFIVHRSGRCFVILNLFPYSCGHLMVVPFQHVGTLEETPEETAFEMMQLTRAASRHLQSLYKAPGLNVGLNIGECAGAGIAAHIHMHVVPRWPGDANFMTVVGETRLLPEDLETTYEKLSRAFSGA